MSQVYRIKAQEIDSFHDVQEMSIAQFLEYMDDKYECINFETAEEQAELVAENYLYLGIPLITSRGFEFTCEDEPFFSVRVNTPATTKDWQTAWAFIKSLSAKVDGKIFNEDDEEVKDLSEINYKADIRYGIHCIKQSMLEQDNDSYVLVATDRDFYLSKEMIKKNWESEDQVQVFDEALAKLFHSSAYVAQQQFYQAKDKTTGEAQEGLLGVYTFGTGYDIILPLEPKVRYVNSSLEEEYGKVNEWQLALMLDDESLEQLDYAEAIKKVKDYRQLDANQIEISAKTDEELREIFGLKKLSFWEKVKHKVHR